MQELIKAVGSRMIQRRDVKAKQTPDGGYFPVHVSRTDQNFEPFKLVDLQAHFAGEQTYGHYLLDVNDNCKFFAFDIDLEKSGFWCEVPEIHNADGSLKSDEQFVGEFVTHEFNPRANWLDRKHPSRQWTKNQMRTLAHEFAGSITKTLGIPTAAAYTGNKGIHVYGFTGECPAAEAREGARIVLDSLGSWEPSRGKVFFKNKDQDPISGYPNWSLEVFPKQDSLESKELGNLMRLPLGRNLKSPKEPTFFIDLAHTSLQELKPHPDPVALLTSGDCWS